MRRTVTIAAVALTTAAHAAPPAAAELAVTQSPGCGEAGRFLGEVSRTCGPGNGAFISSMASSGPRVNAQGFGDYTAFICG